MLALGAVIQLLQSAAVQAGPQPNPVCAIGKMVPATSTFYLDVNGDGIWNGNAGGDRSATINVQGGPGTLFVGDWNGDGFDDPGKLVGRAFSIDRNGNGAWNGNVGGDRAARFAPNLNYTPGVPLIGDWDGDSTDVVGIFETDRFLRDLNGNGVWNGDVVYGARPGGDALGYVLAPSGGIPVVGDWSGDSKSKFGKYLGTTFYLDLNGNGNGRGNVNGVVDLAATFALIFGPGVPLIGDWDGDGVDQIGVYIPTSGKFLLDRSGNWNWDGTPGDSDVAFAAFAGAGTPLVCDWDDDGDDDLGLVVGTKYFIDRNGNGVWDGNAGGDRATDFKFGGVATPVAGRWLPR